MKNFFMLTACEICGEYAKHLFNCPHYGEYLEFEIRVKKDEIRLTKIILEKWKQGKWVDGKPIKLLKKGEKEKMKRLF